MAQAVHIVELQMHPVLPAVSEEEEVEVSVHLSLDSVESGALLHVAQCLGTLRPLASEAPREVYK